MVNPSIVDTANISILIDSLDHIESFDTNDWVSIPKMSPIGPRPRKKMCIEYAMLYSLAVTYHIINIIKQ